MGRAAENVQAPCTTSQQAATHVPGTQIVLRRRHQMCTQLTHTTTTRERGEKIKNKNN